MIEGKTEFEILLHLVESAVQKEVEKRVESERSKLLAELRRFATVVSAAALAVISVIGFLGYDQLDQLKSAIDRRAEKELQARLKTIGSELEAELEANWARSILWQHLSMENRYWDKAITRPEARAIVGLITSESVSETIVDSSLAALASTDDEDWFVPIVLGGLGKALQRGEPLGDTGGQGVDLTTAEEILMFAARSGQAFPNLGTAKLVDKARNNPRLLATALHYNLRAARDLPQRTLEHFSTNGDIGVEAAAIASLLTSGTHGLQAIDEWEKRWSNSEAPDLRWARCSLLWGFSSSSGGMQFSQNWVEQRDLQLAKYLAVGSYSSGEPTFLGYAASPQRATGDFRVSIASACIDSLDLSGDMLNTPLEYLAKTDWSGFVQAVASATAIGDGDSRLALVIQGSPDTFLVREEKRAKLEEGAFVILFRNSSFGISRRCGVAETLDGYWVRSSGFNSLAGEVNINILRVAHDVFESEDLCRLVEPTVAQAKRKEAKRP